MKRFSALLALGSLLVLGGPAWGQTFTTATFYPLGAGEARGIVTADFNSDGNPDIAIANYNPSTVTLLLGTGTGSFQMGSSYSTGLNSLPSDIAVSDVNNDGHPDVLVANAGTSTIGLLLGTGVGTLQAVTAFPATDRPVSLKMADVDADGKADIVAVVTTATSNSTNVLLGNGNGTFRCCNYAASSIPAGGIAVGDVNGDGKLDIVTTNAQRAFSMLSLGNGNGTFQPALTYATNPNGTGVLKLGDLNADGKLDIGFASGNFNYVGTLLGNGNGTFQPLVNYTVGVNAYPADISLNDLNADGKPDMVLVRQNPASLQVFLNDGSGGFPTNKIFPATTAAYALNSLVMADVNRDGQLDAIMAAYYYVGSVSYIQVGVMLNTTTLAIRATLPGASATLYPNPATDQTTLTLAGLPIAVAQVQATLLDATGRAVGQHTLPIAQGRARAEVPTAGLAGGLYMVRLAAYDGRGELAGSLPAQRLSVR